MLGLGACLALAIAGCDDQRPGGDAGLSDGSVACESGQMACEGACVDVTSDAAHCGACGVACGAGEACVDGACALSCPATQTVCGDACADLSTSEAHCGACDAPCAAGESCMDGACGVECPATQDLCGAVCANLLTDPRRCGDCETACDPGEVCSEGVCRGSCAEGLTLCGSSCVDLDNDPLHCGACDARCAIADAADGLCLEGTCRTVCQPLRGDCNLDLSTPSTDGCELRLDTDPANCGACNHECDFQSSTGECDRGLCVIAACDPGFTDCDGRGDNGCESSTASDPMNCGACGVACGPDEACLGGTCTTASGEDCSGTLPITVGRNTVPWTAVTNDYFASTPACVTVGTIEGPDVVLELTAASAGTYELVFEKPTSTRWVAIVSTGACGTATPELACISDWAPATMEGSFALDAGETAYVYLIDTSSGGDPLDNPVVVDVNVL